MIDFCGCTDYKAHIIKEKHPERLTVPGWAASRKINRHWEEPRCMTLWRALYVAAFVGASLSYVFNVIAFTGTFSVFR